MSGDIFIPNPSILPSDDVMTELERVKEEVVFGFYEDQYPIYAQGYRVGAHELSSPITAEEANGMVNQIIDLQRELAETKAALKEIFDEYMPIKQKIISERL